MFSNSSGLFLGVNGLTINRMILMIFQSYSEEKPGEISSEEETDTQRFASVSRDDYIPDSDSEGKIFRDLLHLSLSPLTH